VFDFCVPVLDFRFASLICQQILRQLTRFPTLEPSESSFPSFSATSLVFVEFRPPPVEASQPLDFLRILVDGSPSFFSYRFHD
jgi:hypothetical protein